MQLHECKIGFAVDHESGKQGIICKKPWFRDLDNEWFVPVMRLNGEEELMFPRRLTPHSKLNRQRSIHDEV